MNPPIPPHPTLYQINTRTWLTDLRRQLGRPATLNDVPDAELDGWTQAGFHWIYLLGVWQLGEQGRLAALQEPWLVDQARLLLPEVALETDAQADLNEADICGSCFAVQAYQVSPRLGGEAALKRFRQRLHARGLRLMLDFVPNHTAIDHPWAYEHPDYYIQGDPTDLETTPRRYVRLQTQQGERILAHGRDPYFPPWRDTLQINYSNPDLRAAMRAELLKIAGRCDGLRCDMAMLLLPGIIEQVWGLQAPPFWSEAIRHVRLTYPEFTFMAEVYWNLEWTLQQEGFDYTYDKGYYDRLRGLQARPVHEHLQNTLGFLNRTVHFLENHDEKRAASEFPDPIHPAAAALAYLVPGLRFFHQGQLDGYLERTPMQFCRAPAQPANPAVQALYARVLACLREPALHTGSWRLLDALPGAIGDHSWENVVAWLWNAAQGPSILAVVNFAPQPAGFTLRRTDEALRGQTWQLEDLFNDIEMKTSAPEQTNAEAAIQEWVFPDLHLNLPPWGVQIFRCTAS